MALPGELLQIPTMNKQQQGLQNQSISQAMSMLGQGNKQFDFGPIEQREQRRFQTQTVPGINEMFTAAGAGGGRSSAQLPALSSAGADLSERLAALKGQYGLQQQGLNQNLLGMLFGQANQHSFENLYKKGDPGFTEQILPYLPEILKAFQSYQNGQGEEGAAGGAGAGATGGSGGTSDWMSALSALGGDRGVSTPSSAVQARPTNQTLSQRLGSSLNPTLQATAAGAKAGSAFGPIGTGVGAAGAGLLAFILSLLGSRNSKPGQPQVATA